MGKSRKKKNTLRGGMGGGAKIKEMRKKRKSESVRGSAPVSDYLLLQQISKTVVKSSYLFTVSTSPPRVPVLTAFKQFWV